MRLFSFVFSGLEVIADAIVNDRELEYPKPGGFVRDQAALRGDVVCIGADFKKVIEDSYVEAYGLTGSTPAGTPGASTAHDYRQPDFSR